MAAPIELFSVLLFTFGVNMIPFAGPSNLLIASNAAILVNSDPWSIGLIVALGSTSAKLIHYTVTFFIGKHVSEKRKQRLQNTAKKTKKWAIPAIFIAAASPVPDDPVVIPLGLMRYNLGKFAAAYFAGKLSIAVLGAFLGGMSEEFLGGYVSQVALFIISLVLTIVITVVLLKVDLSETIERTLRKLKLVRSDKHPNENQNQQQQTS